MWKWQLKVLGNNNYGNKRERWIIAACTEEGAVDQQVFVVV